MLNIVNQSTNPFFNLALEEYYLKNTNIQDNLIILWRNCPTVVVGRNQCTETEINHTYIKEHKINVVRRLSGGGAVYHDLGNINFTFIVNTSTAKKHTFSFFAYPIILALKKFNITAEFSGRNDITINGRKISGNAQYFYKNKMLHHGTLLFNTDLNALVCALTPDSNLFTPKTIKSVPSRVTTIKEHLPADITLSQFQETLIRTIFENFTADYNEYFPTKNDLACINSLAETRYKQSKWNYNSLPLYNYFNESKFTAGTLRTYLCIENNTITACKIFGDFFSYEDISEFEHLLIGTLFNKQALNTTLSDININKYFYGLSATEVLSCLTNCRCK